MKHSLSNLMITAALLCLSPLQPAFAEGEFQSGRIVLYNQMDVFASRAPSAEVLASFIKQLDTITATVWDDTKSGNGKSGFITVAIRPDQTMKLWIDLEGEFQEEATGLVEEKMKAVGVPQTRDGPIAFALHFDLWGGSPQPSEPTEQMQIPQLWQTAAEEEHRSLIIPDEILPLVWEESASSENNNESTTFVPEGFSLQELNPTGGTILRPEGWFFNEGHRKNVFMWTISKEPSKDGFYDTGVRIQCFIGVQKVTGESPEEFVQKFVHGKKEAAEIISQRPVINQGIFSRIGIETTETKVIDGKQVAYRILYSCFWGNDSDIVVISIAGTTPDLWDTYESTFNTMSNFKLIDMKHLESAQANAAAAPNAGWKEIDNSSEWRAPPAGYEWAEFKEIDSAFLKPEGWHVATRETGHSKVISILREASVEPTAIGMTINVIKDCRKHTKMSPTDYYAHYSAEFSKGCTETSSEDPIQQGDLTIYRGEVSKVFDDTIEYQVLLFGLANSKTDTLQIIKYTCPRSEWDEQQQIAIPILQDMVINEKL
ncbi:hypothetical protein P4C99_04850 [Pontiellaceae bacterium B1224]|nr:hypothetical protein [Pontiellaceae bacterium B1224]